MTRRHRSRSRGMMLLEILIALMLFSVFLTIAVQLVGMSLRVSTASNEVAGLTARFDGAMSQLRRDAWTAARIEVSNAHTLHIERTAGAAVEWMITDAGGFERSAGSERQEWPEVARNEKFELRGSAPTLIELARNGDEIRRMAITSQLSVASGGQR